MDKQKGYQGHKNWNHWNVSLWIHNDEGLYRLAQDYCRCTTRDQAAHIMYEHLRDSKIFKTPDGAPYSISAIRSAMVGIL